MLPRVSNALSRFIAPIISGQKEGHPQNPQQGFKRQRPRDIEPAHLKVVPPPADAQPPQARTSPPETQVSSTVKTGVAETFIELFKMLRGHRAELSRWMGERAYTSPKNAKRARGSKSRKGVLLDKKIE